MLVNALFLQLLDDLYLCCNTCMVRTRLPQCIISLHPLITDQNILHRIVQRMSHMQLSGDIWGRNHNGKRCLGMIHLGMEILMIQPLLIQSVLYALGVIGLSQFFAHKCSFLASGMKKALYRFFRQRAS